MYGVLLGLLVFLSGFGPPLPQQPPPPVRTAGKAKAAKPKAVVRGTFGRRGGGAGFVVLGNRLFVEAIVIHKERVESGIFLLDTGTPTGCVLETHFAEKLKVMGLGDLTLKFGDREIKHVKATVLDHPPLQQLFKKHTALFQNRPIAGVIGYPALAAQVTVLDFRACTIRFLDHLPPVPKKRAKNGKGSPEGRAGGAGKPPGRCVLPFKDEDRVPLLEVRLNDKVDTLFVLCTGAPFSWIRKEVAEGGGLRQGKTPRSLRVGGVEICPLPFELRLVEKPVLSGKTPSPAVGGCLGMDFLDRFRITFDPRAHRVVLERPGR